MQERVDHHQNSDLTQLVRDVVADELSPALVAALEPFCRKIIEEIQADRGRAVRRRLAPTESRLVDIAAVADMVGHSVSSIERWVDAGKFPKPIPAPARGAKRMWRREVVEQWIADRGAAAS